MIRRDEFEELAIKRNLMYDYENSRIENSNVPYEDIEICAKCNWYVTMDNNKRASNFYSILSLRMKLQLLGLDCTMGEKPENAGECLKSNAEYFKIYAGDDNPTVAMPGFGENGKDVYSYRKMPEKSDFSGGARGNLTVQEHYRWNAYMISCGFIPQSIKETLENGSRNYLTRTHGNLSTFEGLFDFRKSMAEHCGCGEEEYDVVNQKMYDVPEKMVIEALAVGGVFGNVIKQNGSISGAEAGCQAEIGSACSMTAAAYAYLKRLPLDGIECAAEVAMEHSLGSTCDPVGGYVQIPCIERNVLAATRAETAVRLAEYAADTRTISFDAIVKTMIETGKDLKKAYRETSKGGLAKEIKVSKN